MFYKFYFSSTCPICEKELSRMHMDQFETKQNWYANCKNECFKIHFHYGRYKLSIFNEDMYFDEEDQEKYYEYYKDRVSHWKENERYLVELLER